MVNSTKCGGRTPAWVANRIFGCRPPRTGGGVARGSNKEEVVVERVHLDDRLLGPERHEGAGLAPDQLPLLDRDVEVLGTNEKPLPVHRGGAGGG